MKLLFIGLWNYNEPQTGLRSALKSICKTYREINWPDYLRGIKKLNEVVISEGANYDVVFMQLQRGEIILPATVQYLSESGVQIYNFTGDVRLPVPDWYYDLAPYAHTLFSDNHSVKLLHKAGFKVSYFPIAYDQNIYSKKGQPSYIADVVFMGNHYQSVFPLSKFRHNAVMALQSKVKNRFKVFGTGYPRAMNLNFKQRSEAAVYRGAKIGINISHFCINRYTSDRMLRIMGCGCLCLTHWYPEIEKDFTPDRHVVVFKTVKEMLQLTDHYLLFQQEASRIAKAGNELVESRDTWQARFSKDLMFLIKNHEADRSAALA